MVYCDGHCIGLCLVPFSSQVLIDRTKWIEMAEECEKAASPLTCACIIRTVIGMNIDKEDRKRTWLADAEVRQSFLRLTWLCARWLCVCVWLAMRVCTCCSGLALPCVMCCSRNGVPPVASTGT